MWKHAVVALLVCASVAEAKDPPDVAAIKKLVAAEGKAITTLAGEDATKAVYGPASLIATPSKGVSKPLEGTAYLIVEAPYLISFKPSGVRIGLSRDGQSAWVTYSAATETSCDSCEVYPGPTMRASQLVVKTGGTWRIHAALYSEGIADAKINKAGKAGKLLSFDKLDDADSGDASVREAFKALVDKGFDPALATSKDLVGIGSAPKEMTVGGKALVPFVNKKWVGNMEIDGPIVAVMAPSGTTAAVFGDVNLTKTDGKARYAVPFRWFVVFDKDAAGAWTPVHLHFSVAAPP